VEAVVEISDLMIQSNPYLWLGEEQEESGQKTDVQSHLTTPFETVAAVVAAVVVAEQLDPWILFLRR
jgi:hypothetical protein